MMQSSCPTIDILLIGYENQENLGLRSMVSFLEAQGFLAEIAPFTEGNEDKILETIQEKQPRLVGFSLIFQFHLKKFANLMAYLRKARVEVHFTVGGHFPTLRPESVLESIPQVDTIIRHEGELTILELVKNLEQPEHWPSIQGLVYREHDQIVSNAPRPLIQDLDSLPWIKRNPSPAMDHGIGIASMIASRGCLYNCSFCSIRQFYGSTVGPLRRVRSAGDVVAEMSSLYQNNGVGFFIFQDDDFAARTAEQRRWMGEYLLALETSGLVGKIGWKIACRVDDLEQDLLQEWIAHGLMCVYLGVEAGNPLSLDTLNKHVNVAQNYAAIALIKQHQLLFSIGFMLFDPSSTVKTVRENIEFLRQIASDGAFPVSFCKMLPYAGTPIEAQLIREGRIKNNSLVEPDYDFLDTRLDWYAFLVNRIYHKRNFEQLGLVSLLGAIQFNQMLVRKFTPNLVSTEYEATLTEIIKKNNSFVLDTLETLLDLIIRHEIDDLLAEKNTLLQLAEAAWQEESAIQAEISDWLLTYDPELFRVFANQSIKQLEKIAVR